MSDHSNTPSDSAEDPSGELLRLFWQRLGREPDTEEVPSQRDAAVRIVATVGPLAESVLLAAAFADEFARDLVALADELEHPSEGTSLMTPQPPTGSALISATAVRQGQRQQQSGNLPAAERSFRWAVQQFRALGEREAESLALTLLGRVVEMQDRLDEAAQNYHQALAIDRAAGDRFNESVDLGLLGQVAWLQGHLDEAEQLLQQALVLHRRFSDRRNTATTLLTLGQVAQQRGQRWQAVYYFLRARLIG